MIDIYADILEASSLIESTSAGQRFTLPAGMLLLGVKATLWHQNPEYTGLKGSIWIANGEGLPVVKVAESDNSWTRGIVLHSQNYGLKELFFDFKYPTGVPLEAREYVFRLHAESYTFASDSHLAWMKSYPRPVYSENVPTASLETMPEFPRQIVIIGAEN